MRERPSNSRAISRYPPKIEESSTLPPALVRHCYFEMLFAGTAFARPVPGGFPERFDHIFARNDR